MLRRVEMQAHYSHSVVLLSIAVAVLASFTALNLSGRLLVSDGSARRWWIVAASVALGGGIWSMHFIGMLALVMPMHMTYDVDITLASLIVPIVVVGIGFFIVSRFGNGLRFVLLAGVVAGLGIISMHYVGMGAMRMSGVSVTYDPTIVALSIVIALVAATAAFQLAFRDLGVQEDIVAAVVMGLAISGMHYTGMAAATFTMDGHGHAAEGAGIEPGFLALVVATASVLLLLLGLLTAYFDRKLSAMTANEAEALSRSEQRLRALHRNASDVVVILDRAGTVVYEASSAARVLGFRSAEMVGQPLSAFTAPGQAPQLAAFLGGLLKDGENVTELKMIHAGGGWRDMEAFGKDLTGDPAVGGIVLNLRDISERKQMIAELERLAETDTQTGILNRRGFWKSAEREVARAAASREPLTFVMIDIDHFKAVNDTYGHAAGDMVLAVVAGVLRENLRAQDVLGRFGGEEFVVLLVGAGHEAALEVVDRMQRALRSRRIATIKGEIAVTASFGVATLSRGEADLELAIRRADEALYEAKNAGRNCIRISA